MTLLQFAKSIEMGLERLRSRADIEDDPDNLVPGIKAALVYLYGRSDALNDADATAAIGRALPAPEAAEGAGEPPTDTHETTTNVFEPAGDEATTTRNRRR